MYSTSAWTATRVLPAPVGRDSSPRRISLAGSSSCSHAVGDAPLVLVELAEHRWSLDLHLGLATHPREAGELDGEAELSNPLARVALSRPDRRRVEPSSLEAGSVALQNAVTVDRERELRELPVLEVAIRDVCQPVEGGRGNGSLELLNSDGQQKFVEHVRCRGYVLPQLVPTLLLHSSENHVGLERRLEGSCHLSQDPPVVLRGDEDRPLVEVLRKGARLLPAGSRSALPVACTAAP